jgi:hypothetical protein
MAKALRFGPQRQLALVHSLEGDQSAQPAIDRAACAAAHTVIAARSALLRHSTTGSIARYPTEMKSHRTPYERELLKRWLSLPPAPAGDDVRAHFWHVSLENARDAEEPSPGGQADMPMWLIRYSAPSVKHRLFANAGLPATADSPAMAPDLLSLSPIGSTEEAMLDAAARLLAFFSVQIGRTPTCLFASDEGLAIQLEAAMLALGVKQRFMRYHIAPDGISRCAKLYRGIDRRTC